MRSEVDVAAVADPATGVAVYESAAGGWQQMGGTSVGAAIVAALFALGPNGGRAMRRNGYGVTVAVARTITSGQLEL